jgi:16S rRNA (cytosine1402-N4)-methyltransferase
MTTIHVPILLQPIVDALVEPLRALPADAPAHWIVDCTLGGGGHTAGFLAALAADPQLARHRVLAVDQDTGAVERARQRFAAEIAAGRLELRHARFGGIAQAVAERPTLGLLADLGFSSDQLGDAARGISFQGDGPLDMRLDPSRGRTCREILSVIREDELADIIYELGEERFSRRIAAAIVRARGEGKLPETTGQLAELVWRTVPPPARHGRIHPATRTFQALRIHVNGELEELDSLLRDVILGIRTKGRVAIISFHSLEDRRVKHAFKHRDSAFEPLTKKPIEADEPEVRRNPRSRSAKLRIAEKIR